MRAPFMVLISLPDTKVTQQWLGKTEGHYNEELRQKIYQKYRICTAVTHVMGKLWCRISVNAYNCEEDYCQLRDAVLDVLKDEP